MQSALFDPQTAGGLLVSLDESSTDEYLKAVPDAAVIGAVQARTKHLIEVN